MKQLHTIQLDILTKLLFAPCLSFSELKSVDSMGGNQFSFHLHKLEDLGYIIKDGDKRQLSLMGKEYANRISEESRTIERSPKLSVLLGCSRDGIDELEVLIYTRLKHPFYGKQGLFGGKIKYGETVEQAAERELWEETGYNGMVKIIGIKHYLVYSEDGSVLLEDKYMRVCSVHNPSGDFMPCEEGDYQWAPVSQLDTIVTNHFSYDDFSELLGWIMNPCDSLYLSQIKEYTSDF